MGERLENLNAAIKRIDDKKNKLFFFLPSMPHASGGIGVVYEHVKTLVDLGYDAMIVYSGADYQKPKWLGEPYVSLKHVRIDDKKNPLTVSMDDFLIIPEGFSNVMQQSDENKLPCKRIVLCQSYFYVLSSLVVGIGWDHFGIRDVIVVTPTLKDYLERIFSPHRFNIKVCRPSVNSEIFKPSLKPKKPIIAISGRDPQQILNVTKHFYLAYPQYKWVSFKHMADMTREQFAETLSESCLGVWIDKIAGFGTFPVECAKSNVPFIGLIPDILPEYAKDNQGIWTNSILDIPDLIARYFKLWFEDIEPAEVYQGLEDLSKEYTVEQEIENISTIYGDYITGRKVELQSIIDKIKTEEGELV